MPRERVYDYPETEYSRALTRLGWTQVGAARVLGIDPRTSRRYVGQDLTVPEALQKLLRLAVHLKFTEADFKPANLSHIELLIRAIYRYKIGEEQFFELTSRPIYLTK